MSECFDDDLSEDDLYAHLHSGDGFVGDLTAIHFLSDEDAVACVEDSGDLGYQLWLQKVLEIFFYPNRWWVLDWSP